MKNIKLLIQYEGTAYSGWQMQDNGDTVQARLVEAAFKITGREINLIGAGRTDAGVHALGQVANFQIEHDLPSDRYAPALNHYLPADIRVIESGEIAESFHARFDARARRYRYLVSNEISAPFRNLRCYHRPTLDFGRLQAAAAMVPGEHDFSPFCVVSSRKESNLCRVEFSRWYRFGPLLAYEIRADRFLHSMVRSLVGAMLNLAAVEQDKNLLNLTLDSFSDMMKASTGQRVTFTAPACGLYLVEVIY